MAYAALRWVASVQRPEGPAAVVAEAEESLEAGEVVPYPVAVAVPEADHIVAADTDHWVHCKAAEGEHIRV